MKTRRDWAAWGSLLLLVLAAYMNDVSEDAGDRERNATFQHSAEDWHEIMRVAEQEGRATDAALSERIARLEERQRCP